MKWNALILALLLVPLLSATTYRSGGSLEINEFVEGDLMATGGMVAVNVPVDGDLFVSGGAVEIRAPVSGDLTIAAGTALLAAPVDGTVRFAGGSIQVTNESQIGGNLEVVGGSLVLDGTVRGDLQGEAGSVEGPGTVEGENTLSVSGDEAPPEAGADAVGFFLWTAGLFIGGYVFIRLGKKCTLTTASKILSWRALLYGIATIILVPILFIILAISVVGLPLALVLLFVFLAAIFSVFIFVPIAVGGWLTKVLKRKKDPEWVRLLGGVLLTQLLFSIPLLGLLLLFLSFMLGLGGIVLGTREMAKF